MVTLVYFRTPISRALARFKGEHPHLYEKWFKFRWVDVGRDVTEKIDFHGIRIVIPQTVEALEWLQKRDRVQENRTSFITSLACENDSELIKEAKEYLREMGYRRIKKTTSHIYDVFD